jgi:hypothetical protein
MLDFRLYMRNAAYPRLRSEYRWERWLRVAYWFVMFPRAKRTERLWLGKSGG